MIKGESTWKGGEESFLSNLQADAMSYHISLAPRRSVNELTLRTNSVGVWWRIELLRSVQRIQPACGSEMQSEPTKRSWNDYAAMLRGQPLRMKGLS